jgi:hypothetical protein
MITSSVYQALLPPLLVLPLLLPVLHLIIPPGLNVTRGPAATISAAS